MKKKFMSYKITVSVMSDENIKALYKLTWIVDDNGTVRDIVKLFVGMPWLRSITIEII